MSLQHRGLLPSFPLPVQCFAFSSMNPNILFLAFPDNSLQVYDVEARQFPAWSKDLSMASPFPSRIAKRLSSLHDSILGIIFPPPPSIPSSAMDIENGDSQNDGGYAVCWGANWLFRLPLSLSSIHDDSRTSRKRRHAQAQQPPPPQDQLDVEGAAGEEMLANFSTKLVTHYRPILHLDFLSDGELVVVERPLVDVMSTLPPAYFKHKYGS